MKKILILGIFIIFSSCKSQYSTSELRHNFTIDQIRDLNKISDFFKSQICPTDNSNFKDCYKIIPHEYLEAYGSGFWTNINYDSQKELYSEISDSTFSEIWTFCKASYPDSGMEIKSICPIYNGKYQMYLSEYGNKNEKIKKYVKRLQELGDFGTYDINYRNILHDKKNFDLNDPNIQLILAIHYLSLNDQEKRRDKWTIE